MKHLRSLFLLILLSWWFSAYPQNHRLQFDHLGTADGLSQSNVQCILRDSRGFMWFGTPDGLNRYDGYQFTVYKNDPLDVNSISNNYITSIAEDKNGDLWISTLGGGVCRFNRHKEQFVRFMHDLDNPNSISDNNANSLCIDNKGMIWIGTQAGLNMLDPGHNIFQRFANDTADKKSLSDAYIRYVFEDSGHDLWICTLAGGLNLLNRQAHTFTHFEHDKNNSRSIAGNNVIAMFEDNLHRLWVGTDGDGLDLMDKVAGTFAHFKHDENNPNSLSANAVYALNEDAESNLWVGTENGGISILNHATGVFTVYKNDEIDKESISNNSIYSIYRDPKNNMWIGNYSGGIDLANRDKIKFAHYKHMLNANSLSNNSVLSIFEDSKNMIWIGTDGGGLNLFDPKTGDFTHFRHQKNNVQSICSDYVLTSSEDSKGNIWIGTWGAGITVYNPKAKTFRHFKNDPLNPASLINNNAWNIYEDRQKNIWVSTFGGGLDLLNPDNKTFTHYQYDKNNREGISGNNIESIFEDSDGQMWICSDGGGLNLFDKKTKTFTHFLHDDTKNSLSNNSVSYIFEDSYKNLWISTRRGLNKFNKSTKQFTVYTMADGLPDNVIYGILEDGKSNLWISTIKGISCYNRATNSFKNYGVSDGLQSNEFREQAFCKSRSGMMYFGGSNGFNQFFPDSIRAIPYEPPLVITNFQVFNKEVPIAAGKDDASLLAKSISETDTITLSYSKSVFSFVFATLNYTAPEKKQYAYMLENFDKDWNIVGTSRIATYTHLDPGRYLFKVKGLNNEGQWSSVIRSVQVIIKPPFWLTWWFKLAIIFLIAGTIILVYKFRVRAIKAQRAKLQQQVHEQTKQLVLSTEEEQKARKEAEKARVATDYANKELKEKNKEAEHARSESERANRELKLKNKELEQFAYVASHDLQEPLRTTSSFVKLLQQQYHGKIDAKADKYLNFITEASERMKVLIKDLLDFSKIGTKGNFESVDCNVILKNVLADLTTATQEAKATIEYGELPVIHGYPTEIKLLFQNLIINAIKFMQPGTLPVIKISAQKIIDNWKFSFNDNGIGLEDKYSERIFNMFQRLHARNEYSGSGIGLAHCKKIVELHHGKIWVESVLGKGSTFYFTIPEKISNDINAYQSMNVTEALK